MTVHYRQTGHQNPEDAVDSWLGTVRFEDAMVPYSDWYGDWSAGPGFVRARRTRGSTAAEMPLDIEMSVSAFHLERCVNKLRQWRGLASRYDKTATGCRAALLVAGILIWAAR
ncbi:hypothetical protein [Streptomyces sp. NPDC059455]|uniref:hypothetical protein n=1 Tax=Streptomyces sp. NPDC059455 TaxID=3346837 RepID=UPI0036A6097F